MKLGLSFPQTEIGTDPIVIKDFLQAAEERGYDFVTFVDHVLGGGWWWLVSASGASPTSRAPAPRSTSRSPRARR